MQARTLSSDDTYVTVLGPLEVRNTTEQVANRPKLCELIVYLAMHRAGATSKAWSTALWPERRVPPQTIANRLCEARRVLGLASDGLPRLRRNGERHVLVCVHTDWDRFQQLTATNNATQYRTALELVRGRPFEDLRQDQWTAVEGITVAIERRVLKVAATYAETMLRKGRAQEATWAAQVGLSVNPFEEQLHRLIMRSEDAIGNRAGVHHALRHLADVMEIDGDPLHEVHPETAALFLELTSRAPTRRLSVV